MSLPTLFTYDTAAAYLGIHRRTLASLVAAGRITWRRVGERGVRFAQSDLDDYIESIRVPARSAV